MPELSPDIALAVFRSSYVGLIVGAALVLASTLLAFWSDNEIKFHDSIRLSTNERETAQAKAEASRANESSERLKNETVRLQAKNLELEAAFAPRLVEQNLTARALSKFAGVPFAVISPTDFEPKRTAGQIRFLLDQAKWVRSTEHLTQQFWAYPDGVTVHVMGIVSKPNDPAISAAKELVSIFAANNIEARIGYPLFRVDEYGKPIALFPPSSNSPNVVIVEVGPKPLPQSLQITPHIPGDERENRIWGNTAE